MTTRKTQAQVLQELSAKLSQLELDFAVVQSVVASQVKASKSAQLVDTSFDIADAPYNKKLREVSSGNIVWRVKPVNYLLNSKLVSDTLNKRNVFVVNEAANLYIVEGTRRVRLATV